MYSIALLKRLKRDQDGVTALEVAFTFPVVLTTFMAVIEFGFVMFVSTLMEASLREASRYGITGYEHAGTSRIEYIHRRVSEVTLGLVDMDEAKLDVKVYPSFGQIGEGEEFVDGNGNGSYDVGETFTDTNGNGSYDSDLGEDGAGGAGDVVLYKLSYDWEIVTPLAGPLLADDGTVTLVSSMAVRNEPWED